MKLRILPAPRHLQDDIECIRLTEYTSADLLAINVCLNGLPGVVFQHFNGHSPIENIVTRSGLTTSANTLFVYGQMTEPSVMNYRGPFTTIQVILKPHALQTLLGINATVLTNALVDLSEFSSGELNRRMIDARNEQERVALFIDFLGAKLAQSRTRDQLIEASLHLIHTRIGTITVKSLIETLNLSERHFERRFQQAVGVSPQFYIRVKRFNEALRLMKTGRFDTLTDVAYRLNFYDQSHFIRDIKAFSGLTPKHLSHKVDDPADDRVYSYV
jgi:AraC-like DNA-binding protein